MIADTTIAADASATSGVTDFIVSAIAAAMMTAVLLRVSAKTCCLVLLYKMYENQTKNGRMLGSIFLPYRQSTYLGSHGHLHLSYFVQLELHSL